MKTASVKSPAFFFSYEQIQKGGPFEVLIEVGTPVETAAYALSTKGDGIYDKLQAKFDADNDGDTDDQDATLLLALANAWARSNPPPAAR